MTITEQAATEQAGGGAMPPLHLDSLVIEGFRGIDLLEIPRLGRVTLLAGKNGIGKTTVLEAVRVYAAGGRYSALAKLLNEREEVSTANDDADIEEVGRPYGPDLSALFYGRDLSRDAQFSIGPYSEQLVVRTIPISEAEEEIQDRVFRIFGDEGAPMIQMQFRGKRASIPWMSPSDFSLASGVRRRMLQDSLGREDDSPYPAVVCESFGPDRPTSRDIARLWSKVALTPDEDVAARAVGMVIGKPVNRVSVLTMQSSRSAKPMAIARFEDSGYPVPLRSLGDGAVRLFTLVLAIANSKNGFLLIDEAENGMHYTVQRAFWRLALRQAALHNVQVIATTHSADCIRGFAEAANESKDIEGVLYPLSRRGGQLRAGEYDEHELAIVAEQGLEVR